MYKFSIGQKVRHLDIGVTGTVTHRLDSNEVDTDMEPGDPWYKVTWDDDQSHGQEPESQLESVQVTGG